MNARLKCNNCGSDYDLATLYWQCPVCYKPLNIIHAVLPSTLKSNNNAPGLWRYSDMFPPLTAVSLGEGQTPLINDNEINFKLEYFSPTHSFKDRGSALSISHAKHAKINTVVEDSTGNAGISAAAYAAQAKLKARIYVPKDAPPLKKKIIQFLGAQLIECESRSDAANRALIELKQNELYVGHAWDPYFLEGMKTAAYEIYESNLKPESILLPVASGTLLIGMYNAFSELMKMNLIEEIPRLYAVQGEAVAPIYEALHGKIINPRSSSSADGIRIINPPRKNEILNAILNTKGDCFVVDDSDIMAAVKILWRKGLLVEPTSAVPYAACLKSQIRLGKTLIMLTGSGLKTLDNIGI